MDLHTTVDTEKYSEMMGRADVAVLSLYYATNRNIPASELQKGIYNLPLDKGHLKASNQQGHHC